MIEMTSNRALVDKLKRTLLKKRLVLFGSGLLATATVVTAAGIVLSVVAAIVVLPVAVKISLLVAAGLPALFFFGRSAIARFFSGNIDTVAVELENKFPDLKGRLIAAVEFSRMKKTPGYSSELMDMTRQQALQRAGGVNFNQIVGFYPVWRTGRFLAVALAAALVLLLLFPGLFSYSYTVYSNPTSVIAPPLGYKVVPFPGSTEWVKYKDIAIGASVFGDNLPPKARVYHRMAGGSWQVTEVNLNKERIFGFAGGDSLAFTITFRQINKSFDYYVQAGRVTTEVQRVDVVDRPRVMGMKLSVFYPDYTNLPPTTIDENNGTFSAVVGSRVNLRITTNLPVQQAELVFSDSSRVPLKIDGKQAETSLLVDKSQSYFVALVDHLGEKNPDPIEYYITAIPDEYPSIDVLRPGFDVNLGDEMILPLKVRIFDDFGFSSLVLKYTVVSQGRPSGENVAVLHYSDRIKTEGEIEFNWDMDKLNLYPGDFAAYYFEVADNDRISGPKVTRSRQFIARVPSLEEIISQTEAENTQRITNTESLLRSGKELSERLKNAARKIEAQNTEMMEKSDWQQQKELQAIVEKNTELVKEIEKMARQMEQSVEQLNENALTGRDILEKLQQIQKLFEEVATPEMKEAQQKLMDALQNMDPNQLQQAMKDFQMTQQEMLDRLDRTLALLKQMQLVQKMEAMTRQLEQLVERQKNMNAETENSPDAKLPELSPNEEQIRQDLQDLKEQIAELDKLAAEAKAGEVPQFKKFKEALDGTDADQNMQNMSQSLEQKQKQEASGEGKKALSKLLEVLDAMQQQMAGMKGDQDSAASKAMRMALEDANYLSKNQEELLKEAAAINSQSMQLRDMAASQQDLQGACNGLKNQLNEIGRQSPFVASEIKKLVNDATQYMDMATQEFDAKQGAKAMHNQREAMVNLNRAALRLMESLQQQSQCNKGGSCDKNTSNMQSLSEKQNMLNQKTQGTCNNPGMNLQSSSESEARQALQRLAGEQGAIRKSMEELAQEFGGSRQILGRLEDIADEMKKVEEELSSGEAGPEVTERQVQIYSRMLQASRSLYRKDFSEQRQAKTATDAQVFVPPQLSPEILNDRMQLEDRLRQFLGDSYPAQYEEQIKAYFKALLQLEYNRQQNNGNINATPPVQP